MATIGYFSLTFVMIILFPLIILNMKIEAIYKNKLIRTYSFWMIFWIIYIILLSNSGFLNSLDFPPRMPFLVVLPVLISIYSFTKSVHFKIIIDQLNPAIPVAIQSFRIGVELTIFNTFLEGILPQRVTFEGLNYDIFVGISSLIISYLIYRNRISQRYILIWNSISLLILSLTVYSFISSFYFMGLTTIAQLEQFLSVPYIFLPALLLPLAIFYHVISIKQCFLKV